MKADKKKTKKKQNGWMQLKFLYDVKVMMIQIFTNLGDF